MAHVNISSTPANLFSTPDVSSRIQPPPHVFLSSHHSPLIACELIETAEALVNPRGKGIYATDETPDAIQAALEVASEGQDRHRNWSEDELRDRRKRWREFAYEAISNDYISGVILYSETLLDFKLGAVLAEKGIILGVRANGELRPVPSSSSEFIVQGLDDLLPRLQAARAAGARFSKWRVPIACTSAELGLPTQLSLEIHAETLAQFAAVSQQAGLVPIVEPDVDFSADADLMRSMEVHQGAIALIYGRCRAHGVLIEGTLIKPSFPQPGMQHPSRQTVTPAEIALATATMLTRCLPVAVPGVVFLSGGLSSSIATSYLRALNALVSASPASSPFSRLPRLSFSFGRALQGDAMHAWIRGDENAARDAFAKWSKACWSAAKGEDVQ